jgi:hypothetical protein
MKKIITLVCVLIMILMSTSGCALFTKQGAEYAAGVVNIKIESELIKSQYQKIYVLINDSHGKFTRDEWNSLLNVHYAFSETYDRLEKITKNPKDVVTPSELKRMYELAYIGYAEARVILSNHKEGFTKFQWAQLTNFDDQVSLYDRQVRSILDNPNTEDINITLGIIITLGSVAYKYLLPVLISVI